MDGFGEGESQQVGDSIVSFCETVVESSSTRSFAETSDNRFRITMIAKTLERGLAEDIENDVVNEDVLQAKYNWNLLAARSILGFGRDENGPNILLDDTLSSKVDKSLLTVVKNNIVEGFQFGTSIGPLCNDPIRNVKFEIVDVRAAPEPCQKYQILKHAAHSAFLLAKPRIMEPVYYVEVQTPKSWVSDIHAMISGKRGKIKAIVPLNKMICIVKAYLPVFEANILELTMGKPIVLLAFDHWTFVHGDSLDRSQVSKSRDFLLNMSRMKVLDFDFEKCYLVSLESLNVYAANIFLEDERTRRLAYNHI